MPAPRLLIIEDDATLSAMLDMILSDAGYEVLVAEHGGIGLALLNDPNNIRTVLLDWKMPVVSGADFLRQYRALPPERQKAVIVLFTAAVDATRIAREAGLERVLAKPAKVSQILRAIADALDEFSSPGQTPQENA